MKKIITVIGILLLSSLHNNAQEINQIVYDDIAEQDILLGNCTKEGLVGADFNFWFSPEYDSYTIDAETLDLIDIDILLSVKIKIVMGTWCEDSQREIPRFYKIFDHLNLDYAFLKLIGVNRIKQAEGTDVDQLNIELVPTIIFYLDGMEIGRIIESPEESLEKSILKIISSV